MSQSQDARIEQLQAALQQLIDDALPDNWDDEDDPDHKKAWENAILVMGEDPEDYRS